MVVKSDTESLNTDDNLNTDISTDYEIDHCDDEEILKMVALMVYIPVINKYFHQLHVTEAIMLSQPMSQPKLSKMGLKGGISPRFLIIDDGWQQIGTDNKGSDYVLQEGMQDKKKEAAANHAAFSPFGVDLFLRLLDLVFLELVYFILLVRGIETVTTYDSNTGEFIVNTPCESAQKYWIEGAANVVRQTNEELRTIKAVPVEL
ncbi:hypothetical protein AgCh_013302 [Apium graveolens]